MSFDFFLLVATLYRYGTFYQKRTFPLIKIFIYIYQGRNHVLNIGGGAIFVYIYIYIYIYIYALIDARTHIITRTQTCQHYPATFIVIK